MKNILITGVAGFVGSNLADRLLREGGYNVVGIDNLSYGVREQVPPEVQFYNEDIRSRGIYALFRDIDCVFHLAAKNCISDCQNDPVETADINVRGTVNVFEAATRAGVRKVIYAESSAVYEGSATFPTPEDDVHPQSYYSVSKMATAHFAEAYARYSGLTSTALRYFCVYGPRQDYRRTIPPVFSSFIIRLLNSDRPIIYGTGEKRRDFIYIDDVNDFHLQCIHDPRTDGNVYNIGSGVNHSVNEIFNMISGLLKTDLKPLFKDDLPGEAQQNLADIRHARSLGWSPNVDLQTGLARSIEFIRDEKNRGRI
jgi:UDP-glucose 4-epimerase